MTKVERLRKRLNVVRTELSRLVLLIDNELQRSRRTAAIKREIEKQRSGMKPMASKRERRRLQDAPSSTCFSWTKFVPNKRNPDSGKMVGEFRKGWSKGLVWYYCTWRFYRSWIRRSASVGRRYNRSIRGTKGKHY